MLSVHKTQSVPVLFSPPVTYHSLQMTNSIETKKKNKLHKLMSPL